MRGRLGLIASLAAAVVLLGVPTVSAAPDATSVDIVDTPRPQNRWGYTPVSRRVAAGTWVTWSNAGYETHSVTALDGSFDSGDLNPSEGFSWFFDAQGTFEYVCTLHPWMKGRVVVDQPSA